MKKFSDIQVGDTIYLANDSYQHAGGQWFSDISEHIVTKIVKYKSDNNIYYVFFLDGHFTFSKRKGDTYFAIWENDLNKNIAENFNVQYLGMHHGFVATSEDSIINVALNQIDKYNEHLYKQKFHFNSFNEYYDAIVKSDINRKEQHKPYFPSIYLANSSVNEDFEFNNIRKNILLNKNLSYKQKCELIEYEYNYFKLYDDFLYDKRGVNIKLYFNESIEYYIDMFKIWLREWNKLKKTIKNDNYNFDRFNFDKQINDYIKKIKKLVK